MGLFSSRMKLVSSVSTNLYFQLNIYFLSRTVKEVGNKDWKLTLCISIRLIAGVGSAMLTVASTSLLLKLTPSYSSSTIIVGIGKC